jgi:hypothetical protein
MGPLQVFYPEGESYKAYVKERDAVARRNAAAAAAEKEKEEDAGADAGAGGKKEREPAPSPPHLDEKTTIESCGIKSRVPEPLLYVVATKITVIDEAVAREKKPPNVAAAQAALARALGEEGAEADAAAAATPRKRSRAR